MHKLMWYLNIFQLEGYEIGRFIRWLVKNRSQKKYSVKKKIMWTAKMKLIILVAVGLFMTLTILAQTLLNNYLISALLVIILVTQPYILLIFASILLMPIEQLLILTQVVKTRNKLKSLNNLKVIGITGSYGKTTTKEFLYQLLKDQHKTLRTPESFNTQLGIARVVDYELDNTYKFFICELAAYHKGDIYRLCKIVSPSYGILTGITSQHLERFGSLNNIVKAKFELVDYVTNKDNIVVNSEGANIASELRSRSLGGIRGYLQADIESSTDSLILYINNCII